MPRVRSVVTPWLVAAALACASVSVSVDYDPDEDFSGYRTFTWLPVPKQPTGDYRVDNPLLDARIRRAIERNLGSRGFLKVEDRVPDFYVVYHLSIEEKLDVRTVNRGYFDYWGYYTSWPETYVTQYDEGALVIDIANAREKQLVWRGVGVRRLRGQSTPEQTTRDVDEAVDRILAKFPPQPQ
jgi:hypothetical protein